MANPEIESNVARVVGRALGIEDRAQSFSASTRLLGDMPEFDSMAVVSVITALEEHFDFEVDDDDIDAEAFETIGSLADFVQRMQDA